MELRELGEPRCPVPECKYESFQTEAGLEEAIKEPNTLILHRGNPESKDATRCQGGLTTTGLDTDITRKDSYCALNILASK